MRTWQAQIRLKGYKPVSKNFPKKTLAEKWAKTEEAAILAGKSVNPREKEKWTIAEVIDWYFKNPDPHRAFYSKKNFFRLDFLKEELGDFNIQTFTPKCFRSRGMPDCKSTESVRKRGYVTNSELGALPCGNLPFEDVLAVANSIGRWTWRHRFALDGIKNRGIMQLNASDLALEEKQRPSATRTNTVQKN